jgi:hypothetical protein
MVDIKRIKTDRPADSLKTGADKINDSFDNVNTELADQDSRIDNIIAQSGTSDTEVVDARVNARGDTFPVLKDRIDDIDVDLKERSVNVKWYGASGSDQTTTGSIDSGSNSLTVASVIDFEVGQGIAIDNAGPNSVKEVASLQITADATADGNVTVTLDGVSTDVAVLNGDTAVTVADKIRNTTFTGWTTGGASGTDTVTFTSDTYGDKTDATYSAGTTGATGTMSTTTQGVNDPLITEISSIDSGTNTITLVDAAGTTVSDVTVNHDDTVSFQDAVNAVEPVGGVVFIPRGTFKISSPLIMKSGVSIVGVGGIAQSIIYNSSSGVALSFPTTASYTAVRLKDFSIEGNLNKSPTYGIEGGNFRTHCEIDRVRIWKHKYGVKLVDSWYSQVRRLYTSTSSTALTMTQANGVVIAGCMFHNINDSSGFALDVTGNATLIESNFFESSTVSAAINIHSSYANRISNNYFENITGNGVLTGASTTGVVIENNHFFGSNTLDRAVYLFEVDGAHIAGNTFLNILNYRIIASGSTEISFGPNYDDGTGVISIPSSVFNGRQIAGRIRTFSSGTTGRPTDAGRGEMYFDASINKPIWFDGSGWVDSSGTAV